MEPILNFLSLSIPWALQLEEIKKEVAEDAELGELVTSLQFGQVLKAGYSLTGGILRYRGHVVLPKTSPLVTIMLKECHDTNVGGHS